MEEKLKTSAHGDMRKKANSCSGVVPFSDITNCINTGAKTIMKTDETVTNELELKLCLYT